jgi:hypothetical protein
MIVNQNVFLPINTLNTDIPDVNQALANVFENIKTLNNYGIGTNTPILNPIHVNVNTTINTNVNGQIQVIGIRSSTSSITITLPAYNQNVIEGSCFWIFDETGNANTYNITINSNSNLINGSTSNKTINQNYGYITLYCYKVGISQLEFIILGSQGVV